MNYRTSKQIKDLADKVNDFLLELMDEGNENRKSLSIFEGPKPHIELFSDRNAELEKLCSWVSKQLECGMRLTKSLLSPNHVTLDAANPGYNGSWCEMLEVRCICKLSKR